MGLHRVTEHAQKLVPLVALLKLGLAKDLFLRTVITPELQPAPHNLEGLARSELTDSFYDRIGARHIEQRQKICDGLRTNPPIRQTFQQRRQFRRKEYAMSSARMPRLDGIVERFDSQAIADQQNELPLSIPDGIGKHASQPIDPLWPLLFIEMHQDFGVTVGLKAMAFPDQLLAKFAIVVDLPVQNRPDRTALVSDRLMASPGVDNP